jgi:hypothetical protein
LVDKIPAFKRDHERLAALAKILQTGDPVEFSNFIKKYKAEYNDSKLSKEATKKAKELKVFDADHAKTLPPEKVKQAAMFFCLNFPLHSRQDEQSRDLAPTWKNKSEGAIVRNFAATSEGFKDLAAIKNPSTVVASAVAIPVTSYMPERRIEGSVYTKQKAVSLAKIPFYEDVHDNEKGSQSAETRANNVIAKLIVVAAVRAGISSQQKVLDYIQVAVEKGGFSNKLVKENNRERYETREPGDLPEMNGKKMTEEEFKQAKFFGAKLQELAAQHGVYVGNGKDGNTLRASRIPKDALENLDGLMSSSTFTKTNADKVLSELEVARVQMQKLVNVQRQH